eukprot:8564469-Karenia_brevis.AAC.1
MVCISLDNGPDYSCGSTVNLHFYYRLWRRSGLYAMFLAAHAPYHSALHWQVEQQLAQPRRLVTGQHLGRSKDGPDADEKKDDETLRTVCELGLAQYASLLLEGTSTGGKPWGVEVVKPKEEEVQLLWKDLKQVAAFYKMSRTW